MSRARLLTVPTLCALSVGALSVGALLAAAAPVDMRLRPLREPLSPQRSRVGVLGLAPVDATEAERLVARLAAAETLKRDFDWFEAVGDPPGRLETKDDPDLRPREGRPRPDLRLSWTARCAEGWRSADSADSVCAPGAPPSGAPIQASTQIMMGHGPAPRNGMAVAAREVLSGLAAAR